MTTGMPDGAEGKQLERYRLLLFVAGDEPNSNLARANLDRFCQDYLIGQVDVEVIDVLEDFESALAHRVLVTPTLIIENGRKRVTVLGNLKDRSRILSALGMPGVPAHE